MFVCAFEEARAKRLVDLQPAVDDGAGYLLNIAEPFVRFVRFVVHFAFFFSQFELTNVNGPLRRGTRGGS